MIICKKFVVEKLESDSGFFVAAAEKEGILEKVWNMISLTKELHT